MTEFKYEIIDELGIVSQGNNGWKKEFNRVSWSGREPKYDIRDWTNNHEKMGRGVTLNKEELMSLHKLIEDEIKNLSNR